ncbi:four-carbon acid sugar kinase family protein [Microbacterium soli]|uniref:Four-carbon acid sugar kinase family protein n=1 Tax=Microbacterium soli TaxID=446075 RepID=A0ABP7N722_9MICO
MRVLAIADDLTGAAETAAALRETVTNVTLLLDADLTEEPDEDTSVGSHAVSASSAVVLDLDTRSAEPAAIAPRVRRATLGTPHDLLFIKVDSLLRGRIDLVLSALPTQGVVLCPASPRLRRTVEGSVVTVAGRPLSETDAWRHERTDAPRTVADAIGDRLWSPLDLTVVRDPQSIRSSITTAVRSGRTVLCDAVDENDLVRIAAAALSVLPRPALAGSASLARAVGMSIATGAPASDHAIRGPEHVSRLPSDAERPALIIVGSAEPIAQAQLAALSDGIPVIRASAQDLAHPERTAKTVRAALAGGIAAVSAVVEDGTSLVSAQLARVTAALAGDDPDLSLILIGGETARRALDAMSVSHVDVLGSVHRRTGEVEPGAVRMRTPGGRLIITRPGSYGREDSLTVLVDDLTARAVSKGNHA